MGSVDFEVSRSRRLPRGVGVVQRRLLEVLTSAPGGLRVCEIAERLSDVQYSALHRGLVALERRGVVARRVVDGVTIWRWRSW